MALIFEELARYSEVLSLGSKTVAFKKEKSVNTQILYEKTAI